ncbi:helix-turn-helix domain-containing protein [Massilia sp. P8910]|uniref:helix-turn-helix domain-containing protein n=1 Tax=Massilia antarctica TaxID=2765360 RepID=UPI001E3B352F|nr:helix-turn-helix transcriptional regulator [Massilia antarctica]MCE3603016.1 helix-turn-helix domain-containing protein [Massilia antarctica]
MMSADQLETVTVPAPDTIVETWNDRLVQSRLVRGLTMTSLAKALNVSVPAISEWESGNIRMLDADKMMRLCLLLDISPVWLMFGDGAPPDVQTPLSKNDFSRVGKACIFLRAARSAPPADKNELIEAALAVLT